MLPIHLLRFWYYECLFVFARSFRNLILFLEEDLAVSLMWRLLLVPLFHDASPIGRILSLIFRIVRILIGLFAFALVAFFMLLLTGYFLFLPFFAIFDIGGFWSRMGLFLGAGIFFFHTLTHPHKKVWFIREGQGFWQSSSVKKENLSWINLLGSWEVRELLSYLEKDAGNFSQFRALDVDLVGQLAFDLARRSCSPCSPYITWGHFFVAALKTQQGIDNFLLKMDLKLTDVEEALFYVEIKKNLKRSVFIWDDDFVVRHLKGVNRGWIGVPTPDLDSVSVDLTREASGVGFADFIGRLQVVSQAINILSQETQKNVVVVGPPGSGKTAFLQLLARQIVKGNAPTALAIKRLVLLNLTKLLSGIRTQGELADRVKNIFEEVSFTQNVIVAVEEIHNLSLGEVGSEYNLYSLMLPYLEGANFQFIATTEPENYTKTLEKNGSFARLFTKVELPPASEDETVMILEQRSAQIEKKQKIKVSYLAIKKCVQLAARLIHDRVLPDSAIAILEQAQTQSADGWITQKIIQEVVASRINVPVLEVGNMEKQKLLNLEDQIHTKLIDQQEAVKAVSDSLRRSATGLREANRPIGSFLFVGPTGVGKTELARILAQEYFKNAAVFLRFDMSEYQNPDSVSRLIGASGEGGLLTEAVRIRPYALLLLDEFEKADQKILTLFLQVLEDGRLTDGSGRTIDFTHTIIIATSNAASLIIARGLKDGKSLLQLNKQVNDELLQIFTPELINRFDDVVLFKSLTEDNLQKIVQLKLVQLQGRLKEQGYLVEFDQKLVGELAKRGFDPVLGARPLRRLIQDTLEANLSRKILERKIEKGQMFKSGPEILVA